MICAAILWSAPRALDARLHPRGEPVARKQNSGIVDSQCPVAFAKPATPKNKTAIPAAIAQAGSARGFLSGAPSCGKPMYRRLSAGQTATHSRQPVHSTDLMRNQFVHRERRRAGLGALSAIDAGLGVAADVRGTQPGRQSQQRAIRAQETAPEVGNEYGRHGENAEHDQPGFADVPEEVQHLHVGDQSVGAVHEVANAQPPTWWKSPTRKIPAADT